MKYLLNEKIEIIISRTSDPNMDRACDSARNAALHRFGADDCGNLVNVEGWVRSRDYVEIKFVSYTNSISIVGNTHIYVFNAMPIKGNNET